MFDAENPNHHTDSSPTGKEAGLDYTANTAPDPSLRSANQRTINYLVHRMLWDQQEKIDLDDLDLSRGTIRVEDEP